jgi:hypothetical protein
MIDTVSTTVQKQTNAATKKQTRYERFVLRIM